jgi:hypothetical protein
MHGKSQSRPNPLIVKILCFCILCTILIAGLWPFHPPKNEVLRLANRNAIQFGRYGSILTANAFHSSASNDGSSGSIEVWLEPALSRGSKTILAFDSTEHPGDPFRLIQSDNDLVIQRHNVDQNGICRTAQFKVHGVLRAKLRVFITVALGAQYTSVYINGGLATVSPIIGTSAHNLTERLIVGNSPEANNSWSGEMSGLAIYQSELTSSQVAQHYETWTTGQKPEMTNDEAPVALYLFNERGGKIIHNELDGGMDLLVPAHYFIVHPPFLESVWRRFRFGSPGWGFWSDVLVNIGGFVPVGFILLNYLSVVQLVKRPAATAILIGFLLSLAIETLQWFLPTRDSDMTDLLSNTLGTAAGVTLYRWSRFHRAWNRVISSQLADRL